MTLGFLTTRRRSGTDGCGISAVADARHRTRGSCEYRHRSIQLNQQNTMITRLNSIVLLTVLSAVYSRATITVQHHWSMGESGAVTDSIGGANLTAVGTTASVTGAYSATAQDFTNASSESPASQYYRYTGSLNASLAGSTNWGVEFFVRPEFLPNGTTHLEVGLFHLGGTGGNSIALELAQHPTWADGTVNWMVHQPGVGVANFNAASGGVPAPAVGLWNHIVYVNNGGVGEFWVDGIKATTPVPAIAGPVSSGPAPGLAIGAMWSDYRRGFDGQLDEFRLFTFAPGQFDIADTIPEPSVIAFAALASVGLFRRRR
jgi:hypothetical protein